MVIVTPLLAPNQRHASSYLSNDKHLSKLPSSIIESLSTKTYDSVPSVFFDTTTVELSETSFSGEKFNGIVVGLGINLNLTQKDLSKIDIPATSIKLETGKDVDSKKFVEYLAKRFFGEYETLLRKGFKYFRAQYISYTDFIGKNVPTSHEEKVKVQVTELDGCDSVEIFIPDDEL